MEFKTIFVNQNICYGYSKEPSQWDGSFELPKQLYPKNICNEIFLQLADPSSWYKANCF